MRQSLGLVAVATMSMYGATASCQGTKVRAASSATSDSATSDSATSNSFTSNSTKTFVPVLAPNIDVTSRTHIVPAHNVSIFYGANSSADTGSINVTLSMNHPAVILENIQSVITVDCSDDSVAVTFNDTDSFQTALDQWELDDQFVMVTNHVGDCDAEFERGFFLADNVTSSGTNTIIATASKQQLENVTHTGEFTFFNLPATRLSRRGSVSPSASLTVSDALEDDLVLLDISPYLEITADNASFSTNITFSGYLKYNFWTFSIKQLYFDLDTEFSANLDLSLGVGAAYSKSFTYSPDELTYSLIDVPGLIELGPGLAFGVGVDLGVGAAVNITTGASINLADGNVHLDLLDGSSSSTSGWTPTYNAYANITEKAEVSVDPYVSLKVELAFKLLGGLVDLSSGLTAKPGFTNTFTLEATEIANSTTGASLPSGTNCSQGVELESDFFFNLTAFATEWYETTLYSVEVPLWDYCYDWA